MKPKAILKFPKSKSKKVSKEKDSKYPTTLERLTYCFLPKKDIPTSEIERDVSDRVLWIEGELGDLGSPTRDPVTMSMALDYGHDSYRGRKTRGLVISSKELSDSDGESRLVAFDSMRASLPQLASELGVTRWIAVAHDDKFHPHVHFIFSNWNEGKDRRLDIRPSQLEALQSMEWSDSLESGRGSREGREKLPRTNREREIQQYRKGETTLQRDLAQEKEAPILALKEFLNQSNVPRMASPQDLADFLFYHSSLPESWDTSKLKTKSGSPRKNPAIIIDNIGLKLRRFFQSLAPTRTKSKNSHRTQDRNEKGPPSIG